MKKLVRWFFYLLGASTFGGVLWGLPYWGYRGGVETWAGLPWWSIGFIIIGGIALVLGIICLASWAFEKEKT